jgi:hypothetical protein
MKRTILSLIAIAVLALVAMPASAQVVPLNYGNFAGTGVSNAFDNLTSYTVNSTRVELPAKGGIAIIPFLGGSAGATNEAVLTFQVSIDGTNYTTSAANLTVTVPFTAATNVVAKYTLFDRSKLDGARYIRWATMTTAASNTVTCYRVQYGWFN